MHARNGLPARRNPAEHDRRVAMTGQANWTTRLIFSSLVLAAFFSGQRVISQILIAVAAVEFLCVLAVRRIDKLSMSAIRFALYFLVSAALVGSLPSPHYYGAWLNFGAKILVGLLPFVFFGPV